MFPPKPPGDAYWPNLHFESCPEIIIRGCFSMSKEGKGDSKEGEERGEEEEGLICIMWEVEITRKL